jgi:predicted amidophosphoribosyltransferase
MWILSQAGAFSMSEKSEKNSCKTSENQSEGRIIMEHPVWNICDKCSQPLDNDFSNYCNKCREEFNKTINDDREYWKKLNENLELGR